MRIASTSSCSSQRRSTYRARSARPATRTPLSNGGALMRGPLEGIRVFDLTLIMVGPWTTMNLGAMGADVIHVERPGILDSSLGGGVPPAINGTSIGHITWNMNKREMFFDLKEEHDLEMARQLLATCDVFV